MNAALPIDAPVLTMDRDAFGAHVYSTLPDAIASLQQRQSRTRGSRSRTVTGVTVPSVLDGSTPVGVIFRQVGTANYEIRRVIRLAAQHQLPLVIFEYHADRFLTRNRDKLALARPGFYSGLGRQGGRRIDYVSLFDLDAENGRPLCDIKIITGESLIDFHHRLLADECPELPPEALVDCSKWFKDQGLGAAGYYNAFLSLFIGHAILFETFVLSGAEREFTQDVFLPAFDAVCADAGQKPLIVPAEREDWEGDEFWQLYPERLRRHLGAYRVMDRVGDAGGPAWETPTDREADRVGQGMGRGEVWANPLPSEAASAQYPRS